MEAESATVEPSVEQDRARARRLRLRSGRSLSRRSGVARTQRAGYGDACRDRTSIRARSGAREEAPMKAKLAERREGGFALSLEQEIRLSGGPWPWDFRQRCKSGPEARMLAMSEGENCHEST